MLPYPVILIHGIFDTSAKMKTMAEYLQRKNMQVFCPTLSSHLGNIGIDVLATQLEEYIEQHIPKDSPFHIVGFSMGGIVARQYIQNHEGYKRVKTFISIGSPHKGSMLAFCFNRQTCIHLRPNSSLIKQLNEHLEHLQKVECVTLWTPQDMVIVPSSHCKLGLGEEIQVKELRHGKLPENKDVLRIVAEHLIPKQPSPYFFYMVRCADNSLYCGITTDVQRRVDEHNSGTKKSAKYTRAKGPVHLVYSEKYEDKSTALKREYEVKQWKKEEKEQLISTYI